jgi:hypothetical protein
MIDAGIAPMIAQVMHKFPQPALFQTLYGAFPIYTEESPNLMWIKCESCSNQLFWL